MTIKDIAKMAGVTPSTVSRVMNDANTNAASPALKEKIWDIIRTTGYIPDSAARSLKNGNKNKPVSKSIGCIFTSTKNTISDPFFSCIARGVELESNKRGYALGFSFSSLEQSESALYNAVITQNISGLVVLGQFNLSFLAFLKKNFKNVIYAGINKIDSDIDQVICDGYGATVLALEYLEKLGHKRIGFIGSIPRKDLVNEHRYRAFKDKLPGTLPEHIINTTLSTSGGYEGMYRLSKSTTAMPTAVFCANDATAIGAIKAAGELGLFVPEKLSIISIDNVDMACYVSPMLTTVHIPKEELGAMAVKVLIDRIEKGHKLSMKVDIPYKLIIRESVYDIN